MRMELAPSAPDEIFQLNSEYNQDPRKEKINGGIGVYLDDLGNPYVLPVVKKAVSSLSDANFNYLPISGDPAFLTETAKLVFDEKLFDAVDRRLARQGVAGGTNGLFIWGSFIKQIDPNPTIILSAPTWENHKKIFAYLGFNIAAYNHVSADHRFDLGAFADTVSKYPQGYILLHGGPTHNPTGVNPDQKQWHQLMDVLQKYHCHTLFDFAYMGLGNDVEQDAAPIRLAVAAGIPISVIVSYSKNMSLYQHRTGALLMLSKTEKEKQTTEDRLKYIFRIVNSNPPAVGELVVKTILTDPELKRQWWLDLKKMVGSLAARRKLFAERAGNQFSHVADEKGLFSLLDLSTPQINHLKKNHGIYLLSNSRINFGGVSLKNAAVVADAVLDEITSSTI